MLSNIPAPHGLGQLTKNFFQEMSESSRSIHKSHGFKPQPYGIDLRVRGSIYKKPFLLRMELNIQICIENSYLPTSYPHEMVCGDNLQKKNIIFRNWNFQINTQKACLPTPLPHGMGAIYNQTLVERGNEMSKSKYKWWLPTPHPHGVKGSGDKKYFSLELNKLSKSA